MLHRLKRHPLPMRAHFDFVLVVTYAAPARSLGALLPPGLEIDAWNGLGFLAAAFVQVRRLRPAFLPGFLGRGCFLAGYRVFARYRSLRGRSLRGLRILRSNTDSRITFLLGNLLTHYDYRLVTVHAERNAERLDLEVNGPEGRAEVDLTADLGGPEDVLPAGSPFATTKQARRFMGPMPHTFDYESETHSIIDIEGVRQAWKPRLVAVDARRLDLAVHPSLAGTEQVLASCFFIEHVDYLWKRGVREPLSPDVQSQ